MKSTHAARSEERAKAAIELREKLRWFTGSEQVFAHWFNRNIAFSEGVQFLCENAGAYWLLDKIVASQTNPHLGIEALQIWKLKVTGAKGEIEVVDGEGRVLHQELLTFTDFPLDEISIWLADNIVFLPSER